MEDPSPSSTRTQGPRIDRFRALVGVIALAGLALIVQSWCPNILSPDAPAGLARLEIYRQELPAIGAPSPVHLPVVASPRPRFALSAVFFFVLPG